MVEPALSPTFVPLDPDVPRVGKRGAPQAFARKLYEILTTESSEVIGWNKAGTAFHVRNVETFAEEILTKYYRHSKFSSFQRQLNLYSFRKIVKGPDAGGYAHAMFRRERPDDLYQVRRSISGSSRYDNSPTAPTTAGATALPPARRQGRRVAIPKGGSGTKGAWGAASRPQKSMAALRRTGKLARAGDTVMPSSFAGPTMVVSEPEEPALWSDESDREASQGVADLDGSSSDSGGDSDGEGGENGPADESDGVVDGGSARTTNGPDEGQNVTPENKIRGASPVTAPSRGFSLFPRRFSFFERAPPGGSGGSGVTENANKLRVSQDSEKIPTSSSSSDEDDLALVSGGRQMQGQISVSQTRTEEHGRGRRNGQEEMGQEIVGLEGGGSDVSAATTSGTGRERVSHCVVGMVAEPAPEVRPGTTPIAGKLLSDSPVRAVGGRVAGVEKDGRTHQRGGQGTVTATVSESGAISGSVSDVANVANTATTARREELGLVEQLTQMVEVFDICHLLRGGSFSSSLSPQPQAVKLDKLGHPQSSLQGTSTGGGGGSSNHLRNMSIDMDPASPPPPLLPTSGNWWSGGGGSGSAVGKGGVSGSSALGSLASMEVVRSDSGRDWEGMLTSTDMADLGPSVVQSFAEFFSF
ncbi:unnamed protein product [Choristocarpus tenellus]